MRKVAIAINVAVKNFLERIAIAFRFCKNVSDRVLSFEIKLLLEPTCAQNYRQTQKNHAENPSHSV